MDLLQQWIFWTVMFPYIKYPIKLALLTGDLDALLDCFRDCLGECLMLE